MSPFRLSDEYRYASRGIQAELSAGLEDAPGACPICGSADHDAEFCTEPLDAEEGRICLGCLTPLGEGLYCRACQERWEGQRMSLEPSYDFTGLPY